MKDLDSETIINIINDEIEILANRIRCMHSIVVNQDEFLEYLAKRKEQLVFIINNFAGYMSFIDEHLSRKLDVKPMQKQTISIEMAAIDVLLGRRVNKAINEKNIFIGDAGNISYFSDIGYRLNWLLSHIDIDNTLAEYRECLSYSSKLKIN